MFGVACRLVGLREPRHATKLPCPLPFDLNRQVLIKLERERDDWWITLKADGQRAWLFAHKGQAVLISRTLKISSIGFPPGMHPDKTTLLDGEVFETPLSLFVAFDCLLFNDQRVFDHPFRSRFLWLASLNWPSLETVAGEEKKVEEQMQFAIKPTWPLERLAQCFDPRTGQLCGLHFASLSISCDGIVFMDGCASYFARAQGNRIEAASMLKWKPVPTVDLAIFPEAQHLGHEDGCPEAQHVEYEGYCTGFKSPWIKCGKVTDAVVAAAEKILIVECHWKKPGEWKAVRIRKDKHLPNHEKVVQDTIEVVQQNITATDLLALNQ